MDKLSNIYKISNDVNNLVYIGQTVLSIYQRFQEHVAAAKLYTRSPEKKVSVISKAISQIGYEHFTVSLIETCLFSDAGEREAYWIQYYNSADPEFGYNVSKGVSIGVSHTDESKEKIRASSKGRKFIKQRTNLEGD